MSKAIIKTCPNNHQFVKSSDCPTCPICEKENKPTSGFLSLVTAPTRRALLHENIDTLEKLSQYSEKEILMLHGVGPKSMPVLRQALKAVGLFFKE